MTDDATPEAKPAPTDFDPVPALAFELSLPLASIAAVIALLDEGNTVPFIARYRKERTGGLDEVQIRAIEEKRGYLVELEERRAAILASIGEQGKLTPELAAKIKAAAAKSELEDLYAPYRPRRKTRASVARDRGLEPLAAEILAQGPEGDPAAKAAGFVGEAVPSADDALAGARDIVAETVADTAEVRAFVRREFADHGELVSEVVPGKADEPTKFEQYYQFKEAVKTIPSHRFLAIRRGEAEGVLRGHVNVDTAKVVAGIERLVKLDGSSPWAEQLRLAIADALKRLLAPSVENDVRGELKSRSDGAAVEIFAGNLRNLMLASPLGATAVIGVDPGLRTGCKCAAIDTTGKFLGTVTVYISQGDAQLAKAKDEFLAFVRKFPAHAIAVGNGTGGREAEAFVKRVLADAGMRGGSSGGAAGEGDRPEAAFVVAVNEAGASVYSASDLAREEFPELDLTVRGAISIARRLQDPLAELVKIEPKSIGVGQYQHDVHQPLLGKKLGDVVESCVNHVGVELNTASAMLLGYVAGIGKSLAKKIVVHRDTHGAFAARQQLLDVPGLGPKAFEQAAGFLRIRDGANPLDRSAVHPERYDVVGRMAADLGVEMGALVGNQELVDTIDLSRYVAGELGEPTLRDIVAELKKPGRDPRAEFSPPKFRDDVTSMEDLKPGMVLEGVVTNVTAFGAFVDIGVHNDGLVHVSQLSEQFVKDPSEVVKVGQKLTVRVLEIDNARKRIALSAKKPQPPRQQQPRREEGGGPGPGQGRRGGGGGGGGGGRRGPQGEPSQQQGQGRRGGGGGGDRRRDDRPPYGPPPEARGDGPPPQDRPPQDRPPRRDDRPRGDRPHDDRPRGDRPHDDRPRGDRPNDDRPRGDRPHDDRPRGDRPNDDRPRGDRPNDDRPRGDRPHDDRPRGDRPNDDRPRDDRPRGDRPPDDRPRDDRPRDDRPREGGPREGGPREGGPREGGPRGEGGPRRDDRRRDDRRDDRPQQKPDNWGVSGFTNNPFSKLSGKNQKS